MKGACLGPAADFKGISVLRKNFSILCHSYCIYTVDSDVLLDPHDLIPRALKPV